MSNKKKSTSFQNMTPQARLLVAIALVALLILSVVYASGKFPAFTEQVDRIIGYVDAPNPSPSVAPSAPVSGVLDVYVLDVGQGDSIFLRSPAGKTMLVDASVSGAYEVIDKFLQAQGVNKLDIVIGTHPHADHIGGMRKVVENYEIGAYYMPDAATNTATFEKLLDTLDARNVPVRQAIAGENAFIPWDEQVEIRILSPFGGEEYDLNNASVVCRVRFGDTAIMLTGDAEAPAEKTALNELPASYFAATVLKMGHHGSSSSTTQAFFDAVNPAIAIMSLGADNTYGHPHKETLALLKDAGIPYYRTDLDGTVRITLDGSTYVVETEK